MKGLRISIFFFFISLTLFVISVIWSTLYCNVCNCWLHVRRKKREWDNDSHVKLYWVNCLHLLYYTTRQNLCHIQTCKDGERTERERTVQGSVIYTSYLYTRGEYKNRIYQSLCISWLWRFFFFSLSSSSRTVFVVRHMYL